MINIELVFAKSAAEQIRHQLTLPFGATVKQAIELSGILSQYPELKYLIEPTTIDPTRDTPNPYSVGIWYKPVSLVEKLKSGDRIEIYRALAISAMQARKLRSKRAKDNPHKS